MNGCKGEQNQCLLRGGNKTVSKKKRFRTTEYRLTIKLSSRPVLKIPPLFFRKARYPETLPEMSERSMEIYKNLSRLCKHMRIEHSETCVSPRVCPHFGWRPLQRRLCPHWWLRPRYGGTRQNCGLVFINNTSSSICYLFVQVVRLRLHHLLVFFQ